MKTTRIVSKAKGKDGVTLRGWLYRFTHPVKGRMTERRFWIAEREVADQAFRKYYANLEALSVGLTSTIDGWKMDYSELVEKFLAEAPIQSETRRNRLEFILKSNELKIQVLADLNDVARLTTRAVALLNSKERDAAYLVDTLQPVLRQLGRWAFDAGILPMNPLARWRKLPLQHEPETRRAFDQYECMLILAAAAELDERNRRTYHEALLFLALSTCGNRPGIVLKARIADLENGRLRLPRGTGKKLNGVATLPPELVAQLRVWSRGRSADKPLFPAPNGGRWDITNLLKDFYMACHLAFVNEVWPTLGPDTKCCIPYEVAYHVYSGRDRVRTDGMKPKDPAKVDARQAKVEAIARLADKVRPIIAAKLDRRDLYAWCRKTHRTLALGAGVSADAINLQIGHKSQDVGSKHYTDPTLAQGTAFDPALSSRAVYDLLTGRLELRREESKTTAQILPLAAGAEGMSAPESRTPEVKTEVSEAETATTRKGSAKRTCNSNQDKELDGATSRNRTEDLRFTKVTSQVGQVGTSDAFSFTKQTISTESSRPEVDKNCRPSEVKTEVGSRIELLERLAALPAEQLERLLALAQADATPRTQPKQDGDAL